MILTFGVHEGKDIEDVPTSYLEYIVDQMDNRPDVVEEAEAELEYRKKWRYARE